MPLKLASVRSIIYIYFSFKLAEKCQFQNTRKLDASTPLYYPAYIPKHSLQNTTNHKIPKEPSYGLRSFL